MSWTSCGVSMPLTSARQDVDSCEGLCEQLFQNRVPQTPLEEAREPVAASVIALAQPENGSDSRKPTKEDEIGKSLAL